jgi:polyisoprenoid-binding protein YceI
MANFPSITFKSTSMSKINEELYSLKGDLSIKGVSQAIELKAELGGMSKDPWGNEKIAFEVSGIINRKDFGLTYNAALETGGVLIGEEIKLVAEVQFVKQVTATA